MPSAHDMTSPTPGRVRSVGALKDMRRSPAVADWRRRLAPRRGRGDEAEVPAAITRRKDGAAPRG